MVKIEIYNKKTGKIEEVKEINKRHLNGFMFYWAMQCDSKKYGWRYAKQKNKLKKVM